MHQLSRYTGRPIESTPRGRGARSQFEAAVRANVRRNVVRDFTESGRRYMPIDVEAYTPRAGSSPTNPICVPDAESDSDNDVQALSPLAAQGAAAVASDGAAAADPDEQDAPGSREASQIREEGDGEGEGRDAAVEPADEDGDAVAEQEEVATPQRPERGSAKKQLGFYKV